MEIKMVWINKVSPMARGWESWVLSVVILNSDWARGVMYPIRRLGVLQLGKIIRIMVWKVYIHSRRILLLIVNSGICLTIFIIKIFSGITNVIEWELITLNSLRVVFVVVFDWISIIFLGFILIISRRVMFYMGRYIIGNKKI